MNRYAELALYGLLVLVGTVMLLGVGSLTALAQETNTTQTFESQLTDSNGDPIPHTEVKFEQYTDSYIEFGEVHLGQQYSSHGEWTTTTDANGNYSIEIPYETHEDGSVTPTEGVIRIPDSDNPSSDVDMGVFEAGSTTSLNYLSQDNLNVTAADYDGTSSDPYTFSDDSDSTGDETETIDRPTVNVVVDDDEIVEGQDATFRAELEGANSSTVDFQWLVNNEEVGTNSQTLNHTFDAAGEYSVNVLVTPANGYTWNDGSSEEIEAIYQLQDDYWSSSGVIKFTDLTVTSVNEDNESINATVEILSLEKTGSEVQFRVPEGQWTITAEYQDSGIQYDAVDSINATDKVQEVQLRLEENDGVIGSGTGGVPSGGLGDWLSYITDIIQGPVSGAESLLATAGAVLGGLTLVVGAAVVITLYLTGSFLWRLLPFGGEEEISRLRVGAGDDDDD
ncbi:PKD domain-containing protein [Natrinema versiforme]|uniref:PKD domain-containing protein n=1 Tax=Natrinema versiforme TaxID=88724 RepID=A0A4P8WP68_9EURY|nr:PKD domain-containing protein [Natrinema versiforme]QCS43891.1 PKD domain-containing protein [Natrinema versiforme]